MKKKSLLSGIFYTVLLCLGYNVCQYAVAWGIQIFGMVYAHLSDEALARFYYSYIYHANILGALLFLGAVVIFCRGRLPEKTGMGKIRPYPSWASVFIGFGAYAASLVLMQAATSIPAVADSMEAYSQQSELFSTLSPSPVWETLAALVTAPLVEEILFRGLILRRLKQSTTPGVAIVLSAAAFAIFHGNLYQAVYTFVLGLALGYVVHRFSSLWYGVLMHAALNGLNVLVALPRTFPGLFSENLENAWVLLVTLYSPVALVLGILLLREAAQQEAPVEPLFSHQNFSPERGRIQNLNQTKEDVDLAAPECIIAGLGNPGEKYAVTRHNCGFTAVDYIALRENVSFKNLRFQSYVAEVTLGGVKCLLLKPQTFMNLSGNAVKEAAAFYKIPPEKILVLFDDINFEPGTFRIRKSGSAGGHNGIRSIIASLGSENFPRVKMGVGKPPEGWDLMHHVLAPLSEEDREKHLSSLEDVYQTAKLFAAGNLDDAMARYSGKTHG